MSGILPTPAVTIDTLLQQARALLLDPASGPVVPSPGLGLNTLQDVRIEGDAPPSGTQNWVPGEAGYPFGLLLPSDCDTSYPEIGRAWEDWDVRLHIGLTNAIDGLTPYNQWARAWHTYLQQYVPFHRRLGNSQAISGEQWWAYRGCTIRQWRLAGMVYYGPVCRLLFHNVSSLTYGV